MADENSNGQDAGRENQESQASDTAENVETTTSTSASPAENKDADRLAALEAQLARMSERNQLLEKSLQLNERFLQQRDEKPAPVPEKDTSWTQELEVLDKALEPVLQKRLKGVTDPLNQHYNSLLEDNDALRFEMYLGRNNPELLEDEDAYGRTMQQVQSIRDAGRQRGMNISRVDAFVFNEGLTGTRQRATQRKQKRSSAATSEVRRTAEVQAAQATNTVGEPRAVGNSGIQAIREKANRGERLSADERNKLRDFVGGVEI